ncbi:hypothetical protein L596_014507 [Steinernema carpocapsae]|uniref:Uncharacterized protein n=1 Tax=Steinernema carpocapsae TaxID=34508 RepID=A0A4U5ND11_STECR|nr:hypothetical protein L596_014507 [Steinernema carpocapsae]
MSRHTTTDNRRGRKERLLRYLLRRKPCAYITIFEIALFLVLAVALIVLVYFNRRLKSEIDILDRENKVLETHNNMITFAHCQYERPTDYNTDFCESRCGPTAFIWRHHKLKNERDKTCLDRHEQFSKSKLLFRE